jgi:Secretion system C-terminal sorting domain
MKAKDLHTLILLILVSFSPCLLVALNPTDTIKSIPFIETWDSATFTANAWRFPYTQGNWAIASNAGNPSPCATFTGLPSTSNYIHALVSPWFDATGMTCDNFSLDFDLKLESLVNSGTEKFSVILETDSINYTLNTWINNAGFGWSTFHFDISIVFNKLFRVQFVTFGQYSDQISGWFLDNISVTRQCRVPLLLTGGANGSCDGGNSKSCHVFLFWQPPRCNWQIYSTILEYDDGSAEDGLTIFSTNNNTKIGNLFPIDTWASGIIQSFNMEFQYEAGFTNPVTTTVTVYDMAYNILGVSPPFINYNGWVTVTVPDIPFSGSFYAMVDYNQAVIPNSFNVDQDGPYSNYEGIGLGYYVENGSTWGTISDFGYHVVFMQRAACLVNGKKIEIDPASITPPQTPPHISHNTAALQSYAQNRIYFNSKPDSSQVIGYLIYRNRIYFDTAFLLITPVPIADTSYIDSIGCWANYYIRAVYSDGCLSLPSETTYGGCYSGMNENQLKNNLSVTPNPASDYADVVSEQIIQEVDFVDLNGSIVKSIPGNRSKKIRINVGDLSPGIYLVSVVTGGGVAVKKLVVMY